MGTGTLKVFFRNTKARNYLKDVWIPFLAIYSVKIA